MDAAPDPAGVSPSFEERDGAITRVRTFLVHFADRMGLLQPRSIDDAFAGDLTGLSGDKLREHGTVEQILGTIHERWDPQTYTEQEEADPDGGLGLELRRHLLALGDTFGLYDYQRTLGENSRAIAEALPLSEVIALMDELWHEQAGCFSHLPTEADEFHIGQQIAQNRSLLQEFTKYVSCNEGVVTRWLALRERRWYREARCLCDHAIAEWAAEARRWREVRGALRRTRSLAQRHPTSPRRRRAFYRAGSDAVKAILIHNITAEPVHQAMYEAFEPVLPLAALRLQQQ